MTSHAEVCVILCYNVPFNSFKVWAKFRTPCKVARSMTFFSQLT